jgi:ELWxxDGT repeat protein
MKKVLTLIGVVSALTAATAQTPTLIANIFQTQGSACTDHHYQGDYFSQLKNGKIFFPIRAANSSTEAYAYVTDGTTAGTSWLNVPGLQVNENIVNKQYQVYDPQSDKVFFSGRGTDFINSDIELWSTDGTVAGTKKVKEIAAGTASSDPEYLVAHKGKVFFACTTGSASGIWVSDGTTAGTVKLKSFSDQVKKLKVYKDKVYFLAATDATTQNFDLWETDGTVVGTKKTIQQSSSQGTFVDFTTTPNGFYAVMRAFSFDNLYTIDFVNNALVNVYNGSKGSAFNPIHFKGNDYFVAGDFSTTTKTLFSTTGKTNDTKAITTFKGAYPYGINFMAAEKFIAFAASDDAKGEELWITDGTTAGTKTIDLMKGTGSSIPGEFCRVGSSIYFSAEVQDAAGASIGRELMVTDGTIAGTKLVADIYPGAKGSSPQILQLLTIGGKPNLVFFAENDKSTGLEPFRVEVPLISSADDLSLVSDLVSVSPNPTENELKVTLKQGENIQLSIFDISGKQLKTIKNLTENVTLDMSDFPKGLYLIKANTDNGNYQVQKVVKQ